MFAKQNNKQPSREELMKQYKKVDDERRDLWDKYFGKHPLSNPSKDRGTNDPRDKMKLRGKYKELAKLEATWKKFGYGKR